MKRILVTGATGNVGFEVIHYLSLTQTDLAIYAAVREPGKVRGHFNNYPSVDLQPFDFENQNTHSGVFKGVDLLFLLRPPHISDVEKVFRPLLVTAKESGIDKVVFLSVQGVQKSKHIPHYKIEALIQELGFTYIFVRPSYFMQNLSTTLLGEITGKGSITLPAGKARFNWIDVKNIGEATAQLILRFEEYKNRPYEITGKENKSFGEVSTLITEVTGRQVVYRSINPLSFYFRKRKERLSGGFAVVMTLLHFLPRFQPDPRVSEDYQKLTGKAPTTLIEFIRREKEKFLQGLNNIGG